MNQEQEQELVESAKRNVEAFGRLYDENYQKIFGYVLVRTANLVIAQDITSEVFLKALKNITHFKWTGVPFTAWLCRIANNEIANHFRQNGHGMVLAEKIGESITLEVPAPDAEMNDADEKLRNYERFLDVQQWIAQLPVKYQEVLALRFFQQLQLNEIASILGVHEETVKTRFYRGLERLKKMMIADSASIV